MFERSIKIDLTFASNSTKFHQDKVLKNSGKKATLMKY